MEWNQINLLTKGKNHNKKLNEHLLLLYVLECLFMLP